MAKIDLHIHSTFSDGSLSPYQIIDIANQNYVKYISITDHDSIEAYNQQVLDYADSKNITLIKGVEISTQYKGRGIHVLGYNIDTSNKDLIACLNSLKNARLNYLYDVSKLLISNGYIVNVDQLKQLPTVTKAHIAKDIIQNPSNHNLLMKTFNHIPNKGEFIEAIMNEGCPCYIKKHTITPLEASEIIKSSGGTVILAHPVAYTYEDNLSIQDIKELVENMNADGIEAYYLYVNKNNILKNDINLWVQFAIDNNLITTIGTDFHSFDNIRPEIGFRNYLNLIDYKNIDSLIMKLKK